MRTLGKFLCSCGGNVRLRILEIVLCSSFLEATHLPTYPKPCAWIHTGLHWRLGALAFPRVLCVMERRTWPEPAPFCTPCATRPPARLCQVVYVKIKPLETELCPVVKLSQPPGGLTQPVAHTSWSPPEGRYRVGAGGPTELGRDGC